MGSKTSTGGEGAGSERAQFGFGIDNDNCDAYYSRMNTMQEVRREVLALSASERACLAHELILSLDAPSDFELGTGQEAEIQRRVKMVREGNATGRPSDEVFADIKAKYGS